MVIRFNAAALKNIHGYELIVRFVLGGAITVLTGLLAEKYGPVFGGLFLAFPAIFPASASLLEKHQREKKARAGIATVRGRLAAALDARGAVMGAIGGVVFALIVWKGLPGRSGVAVLCLAAGLWLMSSSLLWYVRKHHPWARPTTKSRH